MKKNEAPAPVIIVGAGIAGLTAAWQLKRQGVDALVLEADLEVGGRMRSTQQGDALIDCGAQFLSSAYKIIPRLINEIKLSDEFLPTSESTGFVAGKHVATFHPRKLWQLLASGIMSLNDFFCLAINQLKLFKVQNRNLSLNDITQWCHCDEIQATDWLEENFNKNIADKLIANIINGFYFQSLAGSSASLVAPVMGFASHYPKTMTLKRGMGSLTKGLAEELNIKSGVSALSILENVNNHQNLLRTHCCIV